MARIIIEYGIKKYFNDEGNFHREDGPAIIHPSGDMYWYIDNFGQSVNDNPTDILANGARIWYKNVLVHRDDGPAVAFPNGYIIYYNDGQMLWPKL